MDFFHCLSLDEAQILIKRALSDSVLDSEQAPLDQAVGRISAMNFSSREDVPAFTRSTVDGYAVVSGDTFGAGEGIPATLEVVGEILMGSEAQYHLQPGQVVAIPTGGMLPNGADAVVMMEHTEKIDNKTLLILKAVAPKENVVAKGEDMQTGQIIVSKGQRIGSAEIGALAACGYDTVSVFSALTVGIISTGDEIVDITAQLTAGKVRDINSYALAAMVGEEGYIAKRYGIIPDVYEQLLQCLHKAARECQVVLVSGGSSVGARDHTVQAIEKIAGQDVLFHGLTVKPGKPTIFGMIGAVPVFGLPGHPVSAMTIFDQIVRPALSHLAGAAVTNSQVTVWAPISRNVPSAPGRDDIIRVRLVRTDSGYVAEPIFGKSGLISTLVKADGTVRIPAEAGGIYAGDTVKVQLFRPRR